MGTGTFMLVVTLLQILYIIYVYIKSNRKAGYSDINDYSSDNYYSNNDYSSDNYYSNNDYSSDNYYSNNDYSSDNYYHQDDYNWISDVGFSHCDGNIYHID